MKSVVLLSLTAVVTAASVNSHSAKSYDGYKVFRVDVGRDAERVNGVIDKLGLSTWMGKPRAGGKSDIVVPPSAVESFAKEVEGLGMLTMHEDLGASIREQEEYSVYAGECFTKGGGGCWMLTRNSWVCKSDLVQLVSCV